MSRDYRLFLEDILTCCERILSYTGDLSFEDFTDNHLVYDAVLRNIEIIGEAAKNIPDDQREIYASIEWRKLAGLRGITAHQYFSLHDEIIWDVIQNKISPLLGQISSILSQEE